MAQMNVDETAETVPAMGLVQGNHPEIALVLGEIFLLSCLNWLGRSYPELEFNMKKPGTQCQVHDFLGGFWDLPWN